MFDFKWTGEGVLVFPNGRRFHWETDAIIGYGTPWRWKSPQGQTLLSFIDQYTGKWFSGTHQVRVEGANLLFLPEYSLLATLGRHLMHTAEEMASGGPS